MSNNTLETVRTQLVQVGDVAFACRRFGRCGGVPLLFLNYFAADMDDWDPKVTNGFAAEREVILFDNAGVGRSTGETPSTVAAMTKDCVDFCRALELEAIREWGSIPSTDRYAMLPRIHQRTLIVHGSKDIVVPPINAFLLAQHLPDAQLVMYPDASHGAQSQHAEVFLQHARLFLDD